MANAPRASVFPNRADRYRLLVALFGAPPTPFRHVLCRAGRSVQFPEYAARLIFDKFPSTATFELDQVRHRSIRDELRHTRCPDPPSRFRSNKPARCPPRRGSRFCRSRGRLRVWRQASSANQPATWHLQASPDGVAPVHPNRVPQERRAGLVRRSA